MGAYAQIVKIYYSFSKYERVQLMRLFKETQTYSKQTRSLKREGVYARKQNVLKNIVNALAQGLHVHLNVSVKTAAIPIDQE